VDELFIGSLYPFFTERTVAEDRRFWKEIVGFDKSISIFDSRKSSILEWHVKRSNILLIGGGPLMHIDPMNMLAYAFKFAKRKKKKTAIFGCGVGPITTKKHKKLLVELFEKSDLIILRDTIALENARRIYSERRMMFDEKRVSVSLDPSVEACLKYKASIRIKTKKKGNGGSSAVISLRKFPEEYLSRNAALNEIEERIKQFYEQSVSYYNKVYFVPMHYFSVGGDDRIYINELYISNPKKNVIIQNIPLSLEQTMKTLYTADTCYGMRFHAVVFQTLLNGNNFVLDYADSHRGKIVGFVKDIGFPRERYINLQKHAVPDSFFGVRLKTFHVNEADLKRKLEEYKKNLCELI